MTGLGRPPRAACSLQNKERLARSLRTRPPPADTRRACCHVLSSFQRTGLTRSPFIGLAAVVRRTFQTYQPAALVSSLNFGLPRVSCRRTGFTRLARLARLPHPPQSARCSGRLSSSCVANPHSEPRNRAGEPKWASRRQPCQQARHGAWRFLELEGRNARRPLSTWDAVRLPLRARQPCGEPDEYTALCRPCQQGIAKNFAIPCNVLSLNALTGSRRGRLSPGRPTTPSSAP